jgi:hypothetical protein
MIQQGPCRSVADRDNPRVSPLGDAEISSVAPREGLFLATGLSKVDSAAGLIFAINADSSSRTSLR